MELTDALRQRRSIRAFSSYHISEEEIHDVIDAARYAPSWANTQVWEFIVVRERELIKLVTDTYSENNPARTCSSACSAIIVTCAKMKVSGCRNGKERTKFKEWFMFDLGMAVQNLCLKAHELGLGTVVVGSMNHDACKDLLHVPDGYEVVAAIPIGRPAAPPEKASGRKELKSFVYLDTFGGNYAAIY